MLKRIDINLEDELIIKLKYLALEKRTNVTELIRTALKETYFKDDKNE